MARSFEELSRDEEVRAIFSAARQLDVQGAIDVNALLAQMAGHPAGTWLTARLTVEKYDERDAQDALERGIVQLAKQNIERELPMMAKQVKEARRLGDESMALRLTRQRDELFRSSQKVVQHAKR